MNTKIISLIAVLGICGTAFFALKSNQVRKDLAALQARSGIEAEPGSRAKAGGKSPSTYIQEDPEVLEAPGAAPVDAPSAKGMDPKLRAAFVKALLQSDAGQRFNALSELGITLTNDEFRQALEGKGNNYAKFNETRNVITTWMEADPEAAAAWAVENGNDNYNMAVRTVATIWGQKDPEAAAEWMTTLPEGKSRDMAVQQVIQHIARKDTEQALKLLEGMSDKSMQDWAASSVAREFVRKDPHAAAEWIENLPAGRGRDTAVQQLVFSFAQQEPETALEWAETIDDEQVRGTSYPTIAMYWTKKDPEKAAKWVESLPEGRTRDMSVQSFSREIMKEDPVLAMEWVDSIGDKNLRDNSRYYVASQWIIHDPEAAKEWAAKSDLPENLKKNLLKRKAPKQNAVQGQGQGANNPGASAIGPAGGALVSP